MMVLSYPVDPVNPVKTFCVRRKTLFAVLLTLLLAGPLHTGNAQDVSQLPEQTLGFVVVSDVEPFDASLRLLLAPWGLRFAGVEPTLAVVCPELTLAKRPLLVGLAETDGKLMPFLLLPVDDMEAMAEAIHADRAGDELIATIAGYDLKITPITGGARVSPLNADLFSDSTDDLLQELKPLLSDSVAALRVTDFGLERIASQMDLERSSNRPSRPQLLHIRSLADLWSARSLLPAYTPLMQTLSREAKSLTIHVQAPASEKFLLSCEAILEEASDELAIAKENSLPSIETLVGELAVIQSYALDRSVPPLLTQLALAWTESRPNEIDATRFAPREFAIYREVVEMLVGSITAVRSVTLTPHDDEPLVANQATLVRVRPDAPLADLVREAALRWNRVVQASNAGTPLEVTTTPLEGGGVRLTTDVVAAMGGRDIEGLVPLLEQFYGPQGVRTVDCVPLKDGKHWLISSLSAAATTELLERLSTEVTPTTTDQEMGELHLDRWFAWQQRIEDIGHAETLGRRVRLPMREALPLRFVLSGEEDRIAMQLELPVATYEALAEYWRAEKVAAE